MSWLLTEIRQQKMLVSIRIADKESKQRKAFLTYIPIPQGLSLEIETLQGALSNPKKSRGQRQGQGTKTIAATEIDGSHETKSVYELVGMFENIDETGTKAKKVHWAPGYQDDDMTAQMYN